jgi:hypothetical protein
VDSGLWDGLYLTNFPLLLPDLDHHAQRLGYGLTGGGRGVQIAGQTPLFPLRKSSRLIGTRMGWT